MREWHRNGNIVDIIWGDSITGSLILTGLFQIPKRFWIFFKDKQWCVFRCGIYWQARAMHVRSEAVQFVSLFHLPSCFVDIFRQFGLEIDCFAAFCSQRLRFHSCSRRLQFLSQNCFIIIIAVWVACLASIASVCNIFHLACYLFAYGYFSPVWFRVRRV